MLSLPLPVTIVSVPAPAVTVSAPVAFAASRFSKFWYEPSSPLTFSRFAKLKVFAPPL
jgi:hypothetical protein